MWLDAYRSVNERCGDGRRGVCCRRRCIRTRAARAGAPPTSSATWRNSPLTLDREPVMNKCYRVVPPLEGTHPASTFLDRIYTEVPADKLDHPTCYEGEWV